MDKKEFYPLYQTFCCNIPKKQLTIKQKKILEQKINDINGEQKIALFRLILEHSRIDNSFKIDSIPYKGVESKNEVTFTIESLPLELGWIVWRFFEFCINEQ